MHTHKVVDEPLGANAARVIAGGLGDALGTQISGLVVNDQAGNKVSDMNGASSEQQRSQSGGSFTYSIAYEAAVGPGAVRRACLGEGAARTVRATAAAVGLGAVRETWGQGASNIDKHKLSQQSTLTI